MKPFSYERASGVAAACASAAEPTAKCQAGDPRYGNDTQRGGHLERLRFVVQIT